MKLKDLNTQQLRAVQTVNKPVTLQKKGRHFHFWTLNARPVLIGYPYS